MPTTPEIERLIKEIRDRANRPRLLHPWDYARPRVKEKQEGERGYQAEAIAIVAGALGLPPRTVRNWGKVMENAPDHYSVILYKLDILERATAVMSKLPEAQRAALAEILPPL